MYPSAVEQKPFIEPKIMPDERSAKVIRLKNACQQVFNQLTIDGIIDMPPVLRGVYGFFRQQATDIDTLNECIEQVSATLSSVVKECELFLALPTQANYQLLEKNLLGPKYLQALYEQQHQFQCKGIAKQLSMLIEQLKTLFTPIGIEPVATLMPQR